MMIGLHAIGLNGSVNPVYDSVASLSNAGIVAGLDMTTEAAMTKLAYLFALPNSTTRSVAEGMVKSLRGELIEISGPIFEHPNVTKSESSLVLSDLCQAISLNDAERVQGILNSQNCSSLNDSDYMGNTPLVSSPMSW